MADDRKNQNEELTPLQRYLAKQKSEGAAADQPRDEVLDETPEELRAVPKEPPAFSPPPRTPPPPPPPVDESAAAQSRANLEPASFFARFVAYMIDTLLVLGISLPIRGFMAFFLWFFPFGAGDATVGSMSLGSFLAVQIVTFFYYGWFYSEKGATPGKMLLGLEVRLVPAGTYPSYAVAYLRESLGKYISSLILLLGYIIALFRDDHRALHDLAFGTQVVAKKPSR